MDFLKASTAVTVKIGPFLDNEDGDTEKTGLTIAQVDVQLSKNGAAMAQKNNSTACTHDKLGYYNCPLSTTDTNTIGILKLAVHVSGALAVWHEFAVLHANVYDSLFGDKALAKTDTVMDANVTKIAGSNVSTSTAQLGVNVVNWKGSAAQNMTGDAYARLGAPKGASHAVDVAEVLSAVGDVQVQTNKLDNLADTDDVAAAVRDVDNTSPAADSLGAAVNTAAAGGGGGGTADWTTNEKQQIRSALGVDGTKTTATGGQLQTMSGNLDAKVSTRSTFNAASDTVKLAANQDVRNVSGTLPNVTLASTQGSYAPAKAGDKMDLINTPNATALAAIKDAVQGAGTTLATLLTRIVGTLASGTHNAQSGDAYAVVNNGTYGNEALYTIVDDLNNLSKSDVEDAMGNYGALKATDLGGIETVTDKLDTMLEEDGGETGGYQFTETALENAPTGGGGSGEADWTEEEREQMRYVIGMNGDKTPATGGQIQSLAAAVGSLVGIPTFGVVSPVSEDGKYADLVKSADYVSADGRALSWTSNLWPDLSGATVTLRIETAAGTVEIPCTASGVYPNAQTVTAEPTAAETAALDARMSQFQVWATLAGSSRVLPLVRGTASVTAAIPPSA